MIPYILLAVSPLVLKDFYKDLDSDNRKKRNYLIFVGILLFCFLAFRSEFIGSNDTFNYSNMMRKAINSMSWADYYNESGVEKGFQMFVFGLSRVFSESQWIIVISSLIYTVSICRFIYKNSEDVVLSCVMYVALGMMTFQMQGMRQAIAMSICLFAYEFASQKKLIKFLLAVFLATMIHQTAIVFLVVYILTRLKYDVKNIMLIFFFGIGAVLSAEKIITIANDIFDKNYTTKIDSGGFVATLIHVIIIAFAFWKNSELKLNAGSKNMLYIAILGAICYILRYFGAQQAERISFYFMFAQLILLPNTVANMTKEDAALVRTGAIVLTTALFMYRLYGSNLIPYYFFWQNV